VQRAADDCGVRLVLHCTDGQQRVNRDPQKRQLQPSPYYLRSVNLLTS
jgi:hypothetical protein